MTRRNDKVTVIGLCKGPGARTKEHSVKVFPSAKKPSAKEMPKKEGRKYQGPKKIPGLYKGAPSTTLYSIEKTAKKHRSGITHFKIIFT